MMFKEVFSNSWSLVLIILLAELVLSAPQGYNYNYYANQQRDYNQRVAQAQRIQAQRIAAQNRYHQYRQTYTTTTTTKKPYKVSRADSENAKFLGTQNQEPDETGKTLKIKSRRLFGGGYNPGCYFRNSDQKPASEGRVFWDLNVYNVYPNPYGGGCGGGFGGGGFGGGVGGYGGGLADPYYGGRPVRGFFQNWLGLFLPGGALSSPYPGPLQSQQSTPTDNVDYDASLGSTGADSSAGASTGSTPNNIGPVTSLTPGQLVSGVAGTINSVIQQLSNGPIPIYG